MKKYYVLSSYTCSDRKTLWQVLSRGIANELDAINYKEVVEAIHNDKYRLKNGKIPYKKQKEFFIVEKEN